MKRDWLGLVLETVAICLTLAGGIFVYSWHVDGRFDDLGRQWATRFGEQSTVISALQTQQATLQAQEISMQHQFEVSEARHQNFETDVSRKLDTVMVQNGGMSTDLALLRKALKQ